MSLGEELLALHDALAAEGLFDQPCFCRREGAGKAELALLTQRCTAAFLRKINRVDELEMPKLPEPAEQA